MATIKEYEVMIKKNITRKTDKKLFDKFFGNVTDPKKRFDMILEAAAKPIKKEGLAAAKCQDDGLYFFDCEICGEEFYWGNAYGEIKYIWCPGCKEAKITELVAAAGWPHKMSCDVCGEVFQPTHRTVKTRQAFCENCYGGKV